MYWMMCVCVSWKIINLFFVLRWLDLHRVKAEHCKDDDDDDITDDERKGEHMMNPNLGHPHHLQHPTYHHHHHAMLSAYGGIKEEIPGK